MDEFNSLIHTIEQLLGPNGCPWDREQTMESMRQSLVEETFEVIEAIDLGENRDMEEEIGDLLFNVVFLCRLAEKEGRFTLKDVLKRLVKKLIHRHPHVFEEGQLQTSEEVLKQWDQIKQIENKDKRQSALDGISKELPALARAQKIIRKLNQLNFKSSKKKEDLSLERQVGDFLFENVEKITQEGIEAEHALRKHLSLLELEFREWERNRT